jgi:hypothetical protein
MFTKGKWEDICQRTSEKYRNGNHPSFSQRKGVPVRPVGCMVRKVRAKVGRDSLKEGTRDPKLISHDIKRLINSVRLSA